VEAKIFRPDEDMLLSIKGAPDVLMGRCTHFTASNGDTHVLDDDIRRDIEEIKNQWSAQGRRVIFLGRKVLSKQVIGFTASTSSGQFEKEILKHARTGLTLVGLVAMEDPLRDEIPEVVRILRRAGIRIFMVRPPLSSLTKRSGQIIVY
jgi:sodium/potassium-transporting ATPase subunit alpha